MASPFLYKILLPFSAAAALMTCAVVVSASPNVSVGIYASLDDDGERLQGKVNLRVRNDTGAPLFSIPLWLYPNRFKDPGPGLSDRTVNWIYPSGKDPGGMDLDQVKWNGQILPNSQIKLLPMPEGGHPQKAANAVADIRLPRALAPGEEGILTISFQVEIPERRGRFGRWKGTISLGGGWFPRPMADLTGNETDLPFEPLEVSLTLSVPPDYGAVIHDRVFERNQDRREVHVGKIVTDVLSVVLMDRMEVTRRKLPFAEGIYVTREIVPKQPDWHESREKDPNGIPAGIPKRGRVDYPDRALKIAEAVGEILKNEAPESTLPKRLVMVEIPAWDRLVQQGGGPVLVSDRLWRIVAADPVLAFHDLVLARHVGTALAAESSFPATDPFEARITAEIVGGVTATKYTQAAHNGVKSVSDLIGFASFVPRIDALLYAPQIPFRESFSTSVEGENPLRDEPWLFMNSAPEGRRILAKTRDLLGEQRADELAIIALTHQDGFPGVLRNELGDDAGRFERQWYGEYPSVNYKLGSVTEERLPGGKTKISVEVIREGADIVEPVTVLIEDDQGNRKRLKWNGEGRRGTLVWMAEHGVDQVTLDPDRRLVEDPALTDDHPQADNLDPLPWRPPMITRLTLWGDTETFQPNIQLALAMRRKFDITHSFHLSGSYAPRGMGAAFTYLYHFGDKRTLNARRWYTGPSISVRHHEKPETAGTTIPEDTLFSATLGSVGFVIGRDDRDYFYDPRHGTSFSVGASYSGGKSSEGEAVNVASASARLFGLLSPSFGHTFAMYGGLTGVAGNPPATDLATLSSRLVLRGFAIDETYGRLGGYAVIEYRHNIVDASRVHLLLSYLDRFQGVLFAAAGTSSNPDGYSGLFKRERVFAEVGYGLRLHMLTFGITQYLIALDLAVPLAPTNRTYEVLQSDGSTAEASRAPFKIVFGITQTY